MSVSPAKEAQQPPTLRWENGAPGCTLEKVRDGSAYRYTIDSPQFRFTMSVAPDELTLSQKTLEHVMRLQLAIGSKSKPPADLKITEATLEFVRHSRWVFKTMTPAVLNSRIQDSMDELMHRAEKVGAKHPEKVQEQEERLREYQKLSSEMIEFATSQGLEDTTLDAVHPQISGWIFFPTRGKWVDSWKSREDFVLRVPIGNSVVEFPFVLPPQDRPALKQRPD